MRAPGLTIHVRRGEVYREEPSSRAFPGWRAGEIHQALTESPMSEGAWRALERTARAMGAREGTKPADDPIMRSHGARKWAQGHAAGHREGHAAGHREGHTAGHREGHAAGHREGHAAGHREGHARGIGEGQARERVEVVVATLRARGIEMAADFAMDRTFLGTLSRDALMAAALACTDEADFRRRIRE